MEKDKYGLRVKSSSDEHESLFELQNWIIDQLFAVILYVQGVEGFSKKLFEDPRYTQTFIALLDYMDQVDKLHRKISQTEEEANHEEGS
jgi:hypothetical protein